MSDGIAGRGERIRADYRRGRSRHNRIHEAGFLVLLDRIELSTSPLPRECSTTELQQRRRLQAADFLAVDADQRNPTSSGHCTNIRADARIFAKLPGDRQMHIVTNPPGVAKSALCVPATANR